VSNEECRRILGVSADATAETIRQAYLDLARVWHPDRFQSDERLRKITEDHLREVNEAYVALKNDRRPESRQGPARPRPAQTRASSHSTTSRGSAAAVEDPPTARPDSGPPPGWTSSWTPAPSFRRPGFLVRVSRSISNKAAYTAIVTGLLAAPSVAVTQFAGLLRVPKLDTNLISSDAFQPKILAPMRVIDPHSDIRGAADVLTQWARGDAIDLWKPVRYRAPDSAAAVTRVGADGRTPPADAPRNRGSKRPAAAEGHQAAPLNGADLIPAGRQSGAGELRLSNHTGLEAVVKLVSESHTRRAVYVAPNGSVTLRSIPIGVYNLHVDLGKELDVKRLQFRRDGVTPTPLGPFQFLQYTSAQGISGNHYDVALNPR
jgi:hypothetical protein